VTSGLSVEVEWEVPTRCFSLGRRAIRRQHHRWEDYRVRYCYRQDRPYRLRLDACQAATSEGVLGAAVAVEVPGDEGKRVALSARRPRDPNRQQIDFHGAPASARAKAASSGRARMAKPSLHGLGELSVMALADSSTGNR
jgi:hypothetical protein